MKTIRSYGNVAEAGFAQSLLQAAGIDASLVDENAAAIGLDIRLQAPEEEVERALEILDGQAGLNLQPPGVPPDESGLAEHEPEPPAASQDSSSPRASKAILVSMLALVILSVLGLTISIVQGLKPQDIHAYYRRGVFREHNGDLDGAVADFSSAIALDAQYGSAYRARGTVKVAKGDPDGAMADYNQAIACDPKDPHALYDRAVEKRKKGDFSGAIADYNQAIALDPEYSPAYLARGFVKGIMGDFDGAMADDNHAIALDPKRAYAYNERGNTNALMRNWAAALADYCQCFDLSPAGQDYPRLYTCLIRARLGEREAASKELAAYIANHRNPDPNAGAWVAKIAGYLLGSVTEADLFVAAGSPGGSPDTRKAQGQTCEAWYYAGMEKLLDGDKKAAGEYLQKCIETNQKSYVEFGFARSELKALGK